MVFMLCYYDDGRGCDSDEKWHDSDKHVIADGNKNSIYRIGYYVTTKIALILPDNHRDEHPYYHLIG